MKLLLVVFALVAFTSAYVVPVGYYEVVYHPVEEIQGARFQRSPSESAYETEDQDEIEHLLRERRSLQPGAPNFPVPGSELPTSIGSNIERIGPNTKATINAQHKTDSYDVGAKWSKVIRGPGRSKPNFSVGGTYRW